jgi:hypothetical protein
MCFGLPSDMPLPCYTTSFGNPVYTATTPFAAITLGCGALLTCTTRISSNGIPVAADRAACTVNGKASISIICITGQPAGTYCYRVFIAAGTELTGMTAAIASISYIAI